MKKIIKLPIESTTQIRKTEDSLCELYSHDKNNGLFEFEVTNVKLGNEKPYAMFKFMDSLSVWKVLGTIEDNKIKIAFDTSLITKDETVVCFLYLDDEERTTDFYRFKFKVKVSEIDKLDTYAVKERYFNNSIIVDKLDVVTKKELEEALKGLTVSSVEGVLTETRADELYAKKSEIYDDTALSNRVKALEERPDNNTVYDDTDLRGRVVTLESKVDNDTVYDDTDLKRRVSELENKSDKDTVYDDSDLRGRVEALESKPDNNTIYDDASLTNRVKALEERPTGSNYDDSDLQGRVRALEERPTTTAYDDTDVKNRLKTIEDNQKDYVRTEDLPAPYDDRRVNERLEALETKQDNDTVYNDTDLKNRVEALENRPTTSVTAYDDTDLKRRVSELEQRPDNNTVYDDTDVKERLTNLETKVDKDTVYDDSDIKERLTVLENKPDNNTVYDDTALSNRVKALEDAPKINATDFATKNDLVAFNGELNNKVSSVDFEDFKKTIPAPYNDKDLSDRVLALENKPVTEIHGTGMPNGVVEAPIGTTYIDKNKTNGAFKWIKTTNGGNRGWEVLSGDTGWRTLNSVSKLGNSFVKVRRVNNEVTYQFGGLSWGWFGIVRRGGAGYFMQTTDTERNCFILGEHGIPAGFRAPNSLIGSIYNDRGVTYGTWYVGNGGDANHLRFQFLNPVPTDSDIGDIRVSQISYLTDDEWPAQLP